MLRTLICHLALFTTLGLGTARAQIPDSGAGRVPTLATLVKKVTPSAINISVQGKNSPNGPCSASSDIPY